MRFMRCSAARIRPRCTRWSISVRRWFAFTVFLTALKAAGGEKMTPKFIVKNMLTNKACIGMLLGIILGALGVHKAIDGTAAGEIVTSLLSFITAPDPPR